MADSRCNILRVWCPCIGIYYIRKSNSSF